MGTDLPDECATCGGSGERYWHTPDCRSRFCALAGGIDDCPGRLEPCPDCRSPLTPPALRAFGFAPLPGKADDAWWWRGPVSVLVYPEVGWWRVDRERVPDRLRPANSGQLRRFLRLIEGES